MTTCLFRCGMCRCGGHAVKSPLTWSEDGGDGDGSHANERPTDDDLGVDGPTQARDGLVVREALPSFYVSWKAWARKQNEERQLEVVEFAWDWRRELEETAARVSRRC